MNILDKINKKLNKKVIEEVKSSLEDMSEFVIEIYKHVKKKDVNIKLEDIVRDYAKLARIDGKALLKLVQKKL